MGIMHIAFAQDSTWWETLHPWWKTCIIVAGAYSLHILVQRLVISPMTRITQATDNDIDDRLLHFFKRFYGILLGFATLAIILNVHGIEITPLLAGAGIAGIAIGFAAKESLADILAGIFLVIDRPMRVGDRVKIEAIGREWGGWGDVLDIGLRRSKVKNTDGVVINYPNNLLANSVITNFSEEPGPIRVRVRVQVDYHADIDRVRALFIKAAEACEGVLPDTTEVVTRSLWDDSRGHAVSGVLVEARYRIEDIGERTRIRSRVLEKILSELRTNSIPLPAPLVRVENRS